jgi:hypothetical protein
LKKIFLLYFFQFSPYTSSYRRNPSVQYSNFVILCRNLPELIYFPLLFFPLIIPAFQFRPS